MKKLLLASSALMFAGTAFAADLPPRLPVKAPLAAPVPFTWTGCYIGAQAGYGRGNKDFANASDPSLEQDIGPPGAVVRDRIDGGLVGGQLGCNYQFGSNWVIGLEGDYDWSDLKGNVTDPFFGGKNLYAKTDWLASATGRVGYSWDRVLFYAKGGAAWTRDQYEAMVVTAPTFSANESRSGWTAGFGVEWAFTDNWSAKLEYDHYDFGRRDIILANSGGGTFPANIRQQIDTVKVGVNFRFWGSSYPVVARY